MTLRAKARRRRPGNKASRNRFLYGFDATEFTAPGEDPDAFRRMAKEILAEWQPETPSMRRLVHHRLSHYERFILGETDLASKLPIYLLSRLENREMLDVLVEIN